MTFTSSSAVPTSTRSADQLQMPRAEYLLLKGNCIHISTALAGFLNAKRALWRMTNCLTGCYNFVTRPWTFKNWLNVTGLELLLKDFQGGSSSYLICQNFDTCQAHKEVIICCNILNLSLFAEVDGGNEGHGDGCWLLAAILPRKQRLWRCPHIQVETNLRGSLLMKCMMSTHLCKFYPQWQFY